MSALPRNNEEYGSQEYWESRFATEESFEWLLSYDQLASQLEPMLQSFHTDRAEVRILIVGCGNAPFSVDLYNAGYTNITNMDYSETVIETMQRRHAHLQPPMQWHIMDMTTMSNDTHGTLESDYYHVVLDKAAMDALMTKEKDVWNPNPEVVAAAHQMCVQIARVLQPNGILIQISLSQPHFRSKYLLGYHHLQSQVVCSATEATDCTGIDPTTSVQNDSAKERQITDDPYFSSVYGWMLRSEAAGCTESSGSFGHYLYILKKSSRP